MDLLFSQAEPVVIAPAVGLGQLIAIGAGIATTLAAAVGALWKSFSNQVERAEKITMDQAQTAEQRWLECQKKHDESRTELSNLNREVGEVKGKIAGMEIAKQELADLSEYVLNRLQADDGNNNNST